MTQIRHLPESLQKELLNQGYQTTDNVTWLSGQPELNDGANDGALTLAVHDAKQSGYIHINAQGQWNYYQTVAPLPQTNNSRLAQKFASQLADTQLAAWARQQEANLKQTSSMAAESEQSRTANRGLKDYMGATVPVGIFNDGVSLVPGHPAKDFLEGIASQGSLNDDALDPFFTMKSTAVYYQFGQEYSQTHAVKSRSLQFLYPAAGCNIGSLAAAMAMIESGAQSIKMIATEEPKADRDLKRVLSTLKGWSQSNPNLKIIDSDWQIEPSQFPGGQRRRLILEYLGRRIELVYAMGDSPQNPQADIRTRPGYRGSFDNIPAQYYFSPEDWKKSDIILLHDSYAQKGQTDLLFFKQLVPNLDIVSPRQTVLMADGFGFSPDFAKMIPADLSDNQDFVLPFGKFIAGSYGHSYKIKVKKSDWGESGATHAAGARWFDFNHPLIAETLKLSRENPQGRDWEAMIDFFQLVAARQKIAGDVGSFKTENKFYSHYSSFGEGDYVVACHQWLTKIWPKLGEQDRKVLGDMVAYAFYVNLKEASTDLAELTAEKLSEWILGSRKRMKR